MAAHLQPLTPTVSTFLRSRIVIAAVSLTCHRAVLLSNTSLDGGDIFRILRRTIELLRAVSAVPYVSRTMRRRAIAALEAMNRQPLADNALMGELAMDETAAGT